MSYDALYLSPHLDDAALSCGGQIHRFVQSGQKILVATLMTADAPPRLSPLAEGLHQIWKLNDVMAARRREDMAAREVLGVDVVHGDFLDALYRTSDDTSDNKAFYSSLGTLFRAPDPEDESRILPCLAEYFSSLPRAKRICVPLGAGRHVDHVLTRRAAELAFGESRLEYYEDYPYADKNWVLLKALFKAFGPPWRWRVRVWPLDEDALAVKSRAIASYASQLVTAFRDEQHMQQQVRNFSMRRGGERTWYRPPSSS